MPDFGANRPYDGLRTFIEDCQEAGELRIVEGANWKLEVNRLSEAIAEYIPEPPAILFDKFDGYPAGYRVLSLPVASRKRVAIMWDEPLDTPKLELARRMNQKMAVARARPIPPKEVSDGPVMQNVFHGDDVDLTKFPVLHCHESDGGRYIGTGDTVIMKDPGSGFINVGTYRIQMHEPNLLGIMVNAGHHGEIIYKRYWEQGKACPVVVTFGGDPMVFNVSSTHFGWGENELDYAGGIRGRPIEVINGPITGLPIPAHAEIAIEGEIPPADEQMHDEGPFGEWTGYYAGGLLGYGGKRPVIRVKALYHRNNPILLNMAPQWPGAPHHSVKPRSGLLWKQMEDIGVPDIAGVYVQHSFLTVVAIRQRDPGHARMAGMAAIGCGAATSMGKYVVVVDDDIDPTNIKEVLWAMTTRVNPATDIQIVPESWTTGLEPRLTPEQRASGSRTIARAIFYAVRPFEWKGRFPKASRPSPDAIKAVMDKYRSDRLPFPEV